MIKPRMLPSRVAPRDQKIPLSHLLAHTCTTDRRKSFISTHIANDPGVGVRIFSKMCCGRCGRMNAKAKETKQIWERAANFVQRDTCVIHKMRRASERRARRTGATPKPERNCCHPLL